MRARNWHGSSKIMAASYLVLPVRLWRPPIGARCDRDPSPALSFASKKAHNFAPPALEIAPYQCQDLENCLFRRMVSTASPRIDGMVVNDGLVQDFGRQYWISRSSGRVFETTALGAAHWLAAVPDAASYPYRSSQLGDDIRPLDAPSTDYRS